MQLCFLSIIRSMPSSILLHMILDVCFKVNFVSYDGCRIEYACKWKIHLSQFDFAGELRRKYISLESNHSIPLSYSAGGFQ